MDEKAAIEQCQRGDTEAFGLLYDVYAQRIYRFIYFKTMHRETAEDLTSQTFFKALESFPAFNSQKGTFSAWLYCIARNTVIDHFRTLHPTDDLDSVFGLAGKQDVALEIDNREQVNKIHSYLDKLTAQQRNVIIMRLWDQLSYREIAEITKTSEASCKMSFSRAVGILRQNLAPLIASLLILLKYS